MINPGFRELFAREGELNRSQARERVAQKEIAQLKADLDYERTNNGRTKLDLEKQALKKACKHHKTKAETLAIQLDESKLGKYISIYIFQIFRRNKKIYFFKMRKE